MKYIITESSLDKVIKKYLNDVFDSEDLNIINPYDFDDETGEEMEDENHIIFYIGDDYDADDSVFEWYDCEYFYEDSPQRQNQTCPVVIVKHPYDDDLSDTFGEDSWQEAFKQWMMEKYNLPVTTVEWNRLRK
jgi:hypothetical protein